MVSGVCVQPSRWPRAANLIKKETQKMNVEHPITPWRDSTSNVLFCQSLKLIIAPGKRLAYTNEIKVSSA
jgi:hypothetical protein